MAVVQPFNSTWGAYLQNQSGTGAFAGPWIDTRKCKNLWVMYNYTNAANTGAVVGLNATEDPGLTNFVVLTPTLAVLSTGAAATVSNGLVTVPSGSSGTTMLFFEQVPSICRAAYAVTTGGPVMNFWIAGKST